MLRSCTHYVYASRRSIALCVGVLRRLGGSTRFDLLVEQFDTRELGSTDRHEEHFFQPRVPDFSLLKTETCMRQNPHPPELAPLTVSNAPEYTDPPAGYANLPPLLRALLGALEQRWNGSILFTDACGNLSSVLRCERGY